MHYINMSQYDQDWIQETAEAWIEYKNLDQSMIDAVTYIKTTKANTENVKDIVQTVKSIINDSNNIDFKFDEGLDFFDPESHRQHKHETFPTGYDFLDTVLAGGYTPKTLIVLAGAPKIGKCAHYSTMIKIRNKKTGIIEEIEMGKFHEMQKNKFFTSSSK